MNSLLNTILDDDRDFVVPVFLMLQLHLEEALKVVICDQSEVIPDSSEVSFLSECSGIWEVKRQSALPVLFRSELAARIFAYGYPLDLANSIDQTSEDKQKAVLQRLQASDLKKVLNKLGISWLRTKPVPDKKAEPVIVSGKFK